jgi:hypothetical protein
MRKSVTKLMLLAATCFAFGGIVYAQGAAPANVRPAAGSPAGMLDLQAYGARPMGYGNMGETVVNTTANSPNIKMTSDPNHEGLVRYLNGDGISIAGAGPANQQSTPAAPGVTAYSVHQSAAYQYQCVGIDLNGGLTAASAAASISNGSTNLGSGTALSIASISRDAKGVITVQTSAPHGFVMDSIAGGGGTIVNIRGVTLVGNPSMGGGLNGHYVISSIPDAIHFTAQTGLMEAVRGTGGTATVYGYVEVKCPSIAGTTNQYLVFGRMRGSMIALGRTQFHDNVFFDYGPKFPVEQLPIWYPSAPPISATNGILSTTVASGGGTQNLVLADKATTTLSNTPAFYDDAPAIRKALAAISAGGGHYYPHTLFFSSKARLSTPNQLQSPYYIMSPVQIPQFVSVVFANSVDAEERIEFLGSNTVTTGYGSNFLTAPTFATQAYVPISGGAHPQVLACGKGSAFVFEGLDVGSMDTSGPNCTGGFKYRHMYLNGDGSANRPPLILGGINNVDSNSIQDVVGTNGEKLGEGVPEPPLLATIWDRCLHAGFSIDGPINWVGRGILLDNRVYTDCPTGGQTGGFVIDLGGGGDVFQSPTTSFTAVYGPGQYLNGVIKNFAETDAVMPLFSNWTRPDGPPLYLENDGGPQSCALDESMKSGYSEASIYIKHGGSADPDCIGQNVNVDAEYIGTWTDTGLSGAGHVPAPSPGASSGGAVNFAGPGWPPEFWQYNVPQLTCSVAAGGSVPVGTYNFKLYVIGYNDGESGFYPSQFGTCNATTTAGNQTVNFNWAAVPGAKGYLIHEFTNRFANPTGRISDCHGVTATHCSWVNGTTDGTATSAAVLDGTGLPLIDHNQVAAPRITIPYLGGSIAGIRAEITADAKGAPLLSVNGGTPLHVPQVIAMGQLALGTQIISPGSCATAVTGAAPNTTAASVIHWSYASDTNGIAGYEGGSSGAIVKVDAFPTSNAVNFRVCNNTASPITPGAMSVNWDVIQ